MKSLRRYLPLLFILLLAILTFTSHALPAADELFDLKLVAPGVYAALAKPVYKINCNSAVVVLDDGVLIVDTHSKPSAARALIEQIKTVTDKPVKYVVNTHAHWDHFQGNQAYPTVWPKGLEIVSSTATRDSIEERGIPRVKRQILEVPAEIDGLKAELARTTDPAKKTMIQDNVRQAESYLAELKSMQVALPTLTFDRSLVIHAKSRTVQLLWLGKAHTDGDVFVYLPNEKFIATGDALHGWTPFLNDGYPNDWIHTLEAAEKLEFEYALGGHGGVFRGKAQFQMWEQYLKDLMAETTAAYTAGASIQDAVKRVSGVLVPKYAGKMPSTFPEDVVPNIQKAYRVVSGQIE